MRKLLQHLNTCMAQGQTVVMGTIVESTGSVPRSSGARMLLCRDGRFFGTIGGGEVEGKSIARARELLAGGSGHALLRFDLSASQAAAAGMICGGAVQVLLQRLEPAVETVEFFQSLTEAFAEGTSPVLLTLMQEDLPPRLLIHLPGARPGPDLPPGLAGELLDRLGRTNQPFILNAGESRLHCEPLIRPLRLYLVGAGHVAQATAHLAGFLGFEVIVMDDRAEFANRDRFREVHEVRVIGSFGNCLVGLQAGDYVVIVTRGHLQDQEVLAQALHTEAGYIGMIGSRRKRDALYAALRREGFADPDFLRVHCPIGLPIGGESPEEIALSIVAEIQQFRYKKPA
jgi:xanthine dehydrogenase accessory factor